MSKKHIMWVSDSPELPMVGQSRVARECLLRLKQHYDVSCAGYHPPLNGEDPMSHIGKEVDFHGIPILRIVRDRHEMIQMAIAHYRPDIVVFSHDVFEYPHMPYFREKNPNIKLIGYFTTDGDPIDARWIPVYDSVDMIWSPTHYGKRTITERLFWLKDRIDVIPYGLNHNVFKAGDKAEARMPLKFNAMDKFMGFYVGHNHGKKNLAAALVGWKEFAKDKNNDVVFVCITHTGYRNMGEWGKQPGDYDLTAFWSPTAQIYDHVVDDNLVSLYYRAADILLFPTVGEGFALPPMEGMASGCIPITTNFSGHTDFCNDENSFLMKDIKYLWSNMWMSKRALVDEYDVQKSLQLAYDMKNNDPEQWERKRLAGIETAKRFDWDKTVDMMIDSIENRLYKPQRERINKLFKI